MSDAFKNRHQHDTLTEIETCPKCGYAMRNTAREVVRQCDATCFGRCTNPIHLSARRMLRVGRA